MIPYIENIGNENSYVIRSPYCIVYRYDKFYLNYKYGKNARMVDFIDHYASILIEIEIVNGARRELLNKNDTEAIIIASVLENYLNYIESELWETITSCDYEYKVVTDTDSDDAVSVYYDNVVESINEVINFFSEFINYDELVYNYIIHVLYTDYDVPEEIERGHPDGDGRVFYPTILFIDDMIYIYFEYTVWGLGNEITNSKV